MGFHVIKRHTYVVVKAGSKIELPRGRIDPEDTYKIIVELEEDVVMSIDDDTAVIIPE